MGTASTGSISFMKWFKLIVNLSKYDIEDSKSDSHIYNSIVSRKLSFKFAIDQMIDIYEKLGYFMTLFNATDINIMKINYWIRLQKVSWNSLFISLKKVLFDSKFKATNFFYVMKIVFDNHLISGMPYFIQLDNNNLFNKFSRGNYGYTSQEFCQKYVQEFSISEYEKDVLKVQWPNDNYNNRNYNNYNNNNRNNNNYNNNNRNYNKNNRNYNKNNRNNNKNNNNNKINHLKLVNEFISKEEITFNGCKYNFFKKNGCRFKDKCKFNHKDCPYKAQGCKNQNCNLKDCIFAVTSQDYNDWIKKFKF